MTPKPRSGRPVLVWIFGVIGALSLFFGALLAWASPTLFDSQKFAARARSALDDSEALRRVVAHTLVVNVVEQLKADLIAFRPVVVSAAGTLIATGAFGDAFELGMRNAHQFVTEEPANNFVVRTNEATLLLLDTIRAIDPDLADQIPLDINPALLRLRDASTELNVGRIADDVKTLGTILPIIGVVTWLLAVAFARDRRRVLSNLGFTLTALGVILLAGVRIIGHVLSSHAALPIDERAVSDLYHTFVGGLEAVAWFGIVAGIILAAAVRALAAESRLSPERVRDTVTAVFSHQPRTTLGKVFAAVAVIALGLLMFVSPLEVLATVVTVLGALVFYFALVYLLDAVARPGENEAIAPRRRRWVFAGAAAMVILLIAGVTVYLVDSSPEARADLESCNGRIEYCTLQLDEIALPTAHNASTATEDGFLLANHEHGMAQQLRDGIRGFQIDAYLGSVRRSGGDSFVYTDFDDAHLERISEAAGPEVVQQALEFRLRLGPPAENADQDVYLCHNFCELGAVTLEGELTTLRRFLERNPNEVVVIVFEDALPADELLPVLTQAGIDPYVATLDPDEPMPTLEEMIDSGRRLVIGLEFGDLGPRIPNVFDDGLVQETPFNFPDVAALEAPDSCMPFRGSPDAPLFQFNHWVTPASLSGSRQANSKAVLLTRAERCEAERGLVPNLVAVDFYESGDLFRVVEELNAEELTADR